RTHAQLTTLPPLFPSCPSCSPKVLIPVLQLGPDFLQVHFQASAEQNRKPFVAAGVWILNLSSYLYAGEVLAVSSAVAAQDNHRTAVIILRSPVPIALVSAEGFRKAIFWSEEVDGRSFPIASTGKN